MMTVLREVSLGGEGLAQWWSTHSAAGGPRFDPQHQKKKILIKLKLKTTQNTIVKFLQENCEYTHTHTSYQSIYFKVYLFVYLFI
jgi:hypothetical protein